MFVHTAQIQFQPTCNFPKSIGLLLTFNAGLFTYMFTSFYIKSYNRKPSKAVLDVSNGTANGFSKNTKEALNNNNDSEVINHNKVNGINKKLN